MTRDEYRQIQDLKQGLNVLGSTNVMLLLLFLATMSNELLVCLSVGIIAYFVMKHFVTVLEQ